MEESIRRAEKLVHATNSALAQMKYNMTFDDFDRRPGLNVEGKKASEKAKKNLTLEEELDQLEYGFRSETNEMLLKMDQLLDPNQFSAARKSCIQASKARDRMKEINRKIEKHKREKSIANEIEQSRNKLLNLITQEEYKRPVVASSSKHTFSSKDSETSKVTSVKDVQTRGKEMSPRKTDSLVKMGELKKKSKEDLKSKILETQEIVDRGFQTVRELNQKVESMAKGDKKEKTPSSGKTLFSDITNPKSLESKKTESNETIKTLNLKKCVKCHGLKEKRRKREKKEKDLWEGKEVENYSQRKDEFNEHKNKVVSVRRLESRRMKGAKLKRENLPSLQIKGGLHIQKIYSLEIPAENIKTVPLKNNTVIKIFTHDQIEKEKAEKVLEEVKKENCLCVTEETRENRVECFKCGNLIRLQEKIINPKEIDKLLLKCDFNVFDPRIDEFVEKCYQTGGFDKYLEDERTKELTKSEEPSLKDEINHREKQKEPEVIQVQVDEVKKEPTKRYFKIQELSEQLTKKYREKTSKLEEDHLEFESILKSLFKRVDESREIFDECQFFSSLNRQKEYSKKVNKLTATKPVILSLTDDMEKPEKISSGSNTVQGKERKKKLVKKDVRDTCKSKNSESDSSEAKLPEKVFKKKKTNVKVTKERNNVRVVDIPSLFPPLATKIFNEICENRENAIVNETVKKDESMSPEQNLEEVQREIENQKDVNKNIDKLSEDDMKTENDYESDFERDSVTTVKNDGNRDEEIEDDNEELEHENEEDRLKPIFTPFFEDERCSHKLSTISEVDSELEKRVSETNIITPRSITTKNGIMPGNIINSIDIPNNSSINNDIKDVLSKAFEKGIEYTLQHQRNALESTQVLKRKLTKNDISVISPQTLSQSSEDSIKEQKQKTKSVFSSSKSTNGKLENGKVQKNKSDASASQKTSSTEVVASLKEVLSALKDQFERTQSLADKLTENVKDKSVEGISKKDKLVLSGEGVKNSSSISENLPSYSEKQSVKVETFSNKLIVDVKQFNSKTKSQSEETGNIISKGIDISSQNSKEVPSPSESYSSRAKSLTPKLTETGWNVRTQVDKNENIKPLFMESVLNPWPTVTDSMFMDNTMVANLQKARKDLSVDNILIENLNSPLSLLPLDNKTSIKDTLNGYKVRLFHEEINTRSNREEKSKSVENSSSGINTPDRGSSEGEINVRSLKSLMSDRKRKGSAKSESSSNSEGSSIRLSSRKKSSRISSRHSSILEKRKITSPVPLGSNNGEMSYSEGEIPSNIFVDDCSSIQSIGEVISEHISVASSLK